MYVTDSIKLFYGIYFILISVFLAWFIFKVRRKGKTVREEVVSGIDKREKVFFFSLISVVIFAHVVTLSNLVPWQKWKLWTDPTPVKYFNINIKDYQFNFSELPIEIASGQFVEFSLTSCDVTYGFGVFSEDGTLVFQLQVLPGYANRYVWNFDQPGYYDVRSTEYSGPDHSSMHVKKAIHIIKKEVKNEQL